MKKLGVMEEEGDSTDDMLLNYFRLFSGPLSEPVIKAMMALCGLDISHLLPGLNSWCLHVQLLSNGFTASSHVTTQL